jgi:DNA-binding response OmpR family regulator
MSDDSIIMETATFTSGTETNRLRIGDASVDLGNGTAQGPDGAKRLRRKELQLLRFLYQNTGAIFTRDELLRRVWNYQGGLMTRTVDQTVATLRRKLNDNSTRSRHLITVHGIGYQLQPR